ncbi:MAG: M56 family metallopeptidase [Bacteroidales bacterium]|nr:M56 family metallopeptidase [Bacteroidales bacterium]
MIITEHIYHPAINALGWSILHSVWQIALIALLWKIAMRLAAKSPAGVRYHISLTAMLTIPLSFFISFFRQYAVYKNAGQIVSVEFERNAWLTGPGSTDFFIVEKSYPAFVSHFEAWTPLIFGVYLAGLMILSVKSLIDYSRWYALRKKFIQDLPESWLKKTRQLIEKAGLRSRIGVYLSGKTDIPMVVGFIKPVILLPVAMLTSLSTEQVEVIILHELCHIKRRDHYVNALQCLLEILFFYHPACWWISRELRAEREKSVDEWVVGQSGEPLVYARALVHLEENRGHTAPQPAVAATQSKSLLFTRIKNFMTMKTRTFNAGQKLAAVMAIVAAFVSLAWISPDTTINLFEASPSETMIADLSYAGDVAEGHYGDPPVNGSLPARDNQRQDEKEPRIIYLHDGTEIQWEGLSEKDREQLRTAMEEMKTAMREVNSEVFEHPRSEEFRKELQQALQEAQNAGKEVKKAMEELRIHFNSEEFREEMRQAQQDIKEALKELDEVDWEAIREEVREAVKTLNEGLEYMNMGLDEIDPELRDLFKEIGRGLEELGPFLNNVMEGIGAGLEELGPALQELMKQLAEPEED